MSDSGKPASPPPSPSSSSPSSSSSSKLPSTTDSSKNAGEQSPKSSLPPWLNARVVFLIIVLIAILVAWVLLSTISNLAPYRDAWLRGGVLAILTIPAVGVFLLTYFAYRNNQEPIQKDRVKDDFFFLGLADEADLEQVVDKLFQNVYNPGQFLTFAILITLLTLAMGMAFLIHTGSVLGQLATATGGVAFIDVTNSPEETNMIFAAFLGAYLFSIQELIRRYNTFDLLPQVYSSIFVRMIVATGVVGVATALVNFESGSATLAYVVAFFIGYFPQRGIDWLWQKSNEIFITRQRPATTRPLDTIIGISNWHEARLLEMGIDDAQNLAMVDIRKLLLTTQFDTQAIVNWIDQSILYVKVGEKLDGLRGIQLLTFSELHNAITDALETVVEDDETANGTAETKAAFVAGLLRLLGLADVGELLRLKDASNYPNFYHITEYYDRSIDAVQRRADAGSKAIFNSDLPLLEMHFELDQSDSNQSEGALQRQIYTVEQRLSRRPKESRLWQTIGTYKQQLAKQQAKRLAEIPNTADAAPEVVEARRKLEEQHARTNSEAKEAFDNAIRYGQQDKYAYLRRAAYLLADKSALALDDCSRALRLDPGLAAAYNYRGIAQYNLGYNDLAIKDFTRALEIDDRMADAYLNRGLLYNSTSEFAAAEADMQRAYLCTRNTPSATLLASWGKALFGQNQWQEAIIKLTEAIALDPKSAVPYVDRGYAYFRDGKYREAESDSLVAIGLDPTAYFAYETLGRTYLKQGRFRDAIARFDSASKFAPDATTASHSRLSQGYAYLNLGEYAEAVKVYDNILADNPDFNEARLQLALAHQGANDPAQAKAHLQYIIDHNLPTSPFVIQAQMRLKEGIGQPSTSPQPMITGNVNGTHQPGGNGNHPGVVVVPAAETPVNGQPSGGQPAAKPGTPANGSPGKQPDGSTPPANP